MFFAGRTAAHERAEESSRSSHGSKTTKKAAFNGPSHIFSQKYETTNAESMDHLGSLGLQLEFGLL